MEDKSLASTRFPERETNWLAFFAGFLRNPQEVGSVIPSSRFLEQKIIDAADLSEARLILELGPGTGGTTRAILSQLPNDAKLLTIDMSAEFIDLLDSIPDPRLINHLGSAEDLCHILNSHELDAPDAVISGIPFSTMPKAVGEKVAQAVSEVLADGGRFVAYQFRSDVADITCPIMGEPDVTTEWRNVPPMRIYRWQKQVAGDGSSA